ncbi:hypothetical protein B0H16DRAFT_1327498, partial [Mycena metata]
MHVLTKSDVLAISKLHGVWIPSKYSAAECKASLKGHKCSECDSIVSIFANVTVIPKVHGKPAEIDTRGFPPARPKKRRNIVKSEARLSHEAAKDASTVYGLLTGRLKQTGRLTDQKFPPKPLNKAGIHRIVSNHCKKLRPITFVESGCAVCGCLVK